MKILSTYYLSDWYVITCIQTVNNKKYKVKFSIRADVWNITGSDQCNRNKTSTKRVRQVD